MTGGDSASVRQWAAPALAWSAGGHVVRQVLTLGFLVLQVRLLSPRDFGLIALATTITGVAELAAQAGLPAAIVQRRALEPSHLAAGFWLSLVTGMLAALVIVFGAPAIAALFSEAVLASMLMLMAVNVVLVSTSAVPNAIRIRRVDFHTISIQETVAVAVAGGLGTALAWSGFGVWSLVAQTVASSAITAILAWGFARWRPSADFRWSAARELMRFGAQASATNLVHYAARHVDDVLVARFLGAGALGIYSRAYALMLLPVTHVSGVLTRVLFPSLARIRDDRAGTAALVLGMMRAVAMLTFPVMLGLGVTAEPFVLTVFGPRWVDVIPVLRILVLVGLLQSITTLAGSMFLSQGRAELQLRLSVVLMANVVAPVLIGLRWGIVRVAACYAVAATINVVPTLWIAGRLVHLTLLDIARSLAPMLASSIVMAAFVWLLGQATSEEWSPALRFALQVAAGVLVYAGCLWTIERSAFRELAGWLRATASEPPATDPSAGA